MAGRPADVVPIETTDGPMPLHVRHPAEPGRGAVIVLQEALGVTEHLLDVAGRLAAAGYVGVCPELYHRSGVGSVAYGDYDAIYSQLAAVDDTTFLADLDATISHLLGQGWAAVEIGAVGFNIGARVSFLLSVNRTIGAAVGFYGSGIVTAGTGRDVSFPSLLPLTAPLRTPWLGLYGDRDHTVPIADVDRLEAELRDRNGHIARFRDAGHSFHNDQRPDLYVESAARAAWQHALDWFGTHLAPTAR
jgi:carboxymethylenebutenolidase